MQILHFVLFPLRLLHVCSFLVVGLQVTVTVEKSTEEAHAVKEMMLTNCVKTIQDQLARYITDLQHGAISLMCPVIDDYARIALAVLA